MQTFILCEPQKGIYSHTLKRLQKWRTDDTSSLISSQTQ